MSEWTRVNEVDSLNIELVKMQRLYEDAMAKLNDANVLLMQEVYDHNQLVKSNELLKEYLGVVLADNEKLTKDIYVK